MKFTPSVFSDIPRVFQKDILLLGVFMLDFLGLIRCIQPLALVNFGIPFGSLRSFSFGIPIYIKTNAPILPNIGAR